MTYADNGFYEAFPHFRVYSYLFDVGLIDYNPHVVGPPKEITYYVNPLPDIPDKQIPILALGQAITQWENDNNLVFSEVSNSPFITINWLEYEQKDHVGMATCDYVNENITICILDITLGADDCTGEYVQKTVNTVSNTIMHEFGHAFGLEHHVSEEHLMYGHDEFLEINFDDRDYNIPEKFPEYYVGQEELENVYHVSMEKIDTMDREIDAYEVQWEEMNAKYETIVAKLNTQYNESDYNSAKMLEIKLDILSDTMNNLIHPRNAIAEKTIVITEQVNCFPNVELE